MKPYWEKAMGERFSVIPIAVAQVEPRNIYARKPIKTLADLKGMKIRAQGPVETDFTRAIGATPVTTDWPEVYPALQQGVIDGYWVTHSATFNAKLHEVAKYEWDVGLGGATWYVIVNRAAFNKLPPELQKMVLELGREASEKVWARVDKDIKDFRARLEKVGMSFIPAPAEDMKVMVEKSKGLWNDWIQKAGADGKEMVEKIQAIVGQSRAQLK
jgi:TRAP-type C4-dicarboxylate transport system substrate-binding protein